MNHEKYINQKFGKLVITKYLGVTKYYGRKFEAICDCGETRIVTQTDVSRKINPVYCCKNCLYLKACDNMKEKCYKAVKWCGNKRGYYFNIKLEEWFILSQKVCFYCGQNYKNKYNTYAKKSEPFYYMGLDRVNNNDGYSLENVVPCCIKCNKAKGKMSQKEFLELINNIYETQKNSIL